MYKLSVAEANLSNKARSRYTNFVLSVAELTIKYNELETTEACLKDHVIAIKRCFAADIQPHNSEGNIGLRPLEGFSVDYTARVDLGVLGVLLLEEQDTKHQHKSYFRRTFGHLPRQNH